MYNIKKLLSKNLRFYRCKKNISQLKAAELTDLSPTYYNAIENSKYFPSAETLNVICEKFGIQPFQLFLDNPEIQNSNALLDSFSLTKLKKDIETLIKKYYEDLK